MNITWRFKKRLIHWLVFTAMLAAASAIAVTVNDHALKNWLAGTILICGSALLVFLLLRDLFRALSER